MDFRTIIHRACKGSCHGLSYQMRVLRIGLCAEGEIRTRNTCLQGRVKGKINTASIPISLLPRGDGIDCDCLLVTLHTRRKMFTTIPNYYGMEGSQSRSLSLAESEGFEPSNRINGQHLSGVPLSATQARLQTIPSNPTNTVGRNQAPYDGFEPPPKVPKTRVLPLH